MRLAFREKPYDLFLTAAVSLSVLPAVAFASGPMQLAVGFVAVLFLPGYAITATLFPKEGEIDWVERVAMSAGLSIAVVPVLGLLLNFTPWGVRLAPAIAALLLFTLGMCAVAYLRRMKVPTGDRLGLAVELVRPSWRQLGGLDRALALGLVASFAIGVGALVLLEATPRQGERFSEFYLLDANGGIDGYPLDLNVSEEAVLIVGIVNREMQSVSYTVEVRRVTLEIVWNGTTGKNDTVERESLTVDTFLVNLSNNERWEAPYSFQIPDPGDYRIRFLLFIGPPQADPYRTVDLRIRVT